MLELILATFIPSLPVSVEGQSPSGYEVVELFHADTSDELEAALSDGYPMPWLEEVLNDESIPEEDRYWLDCRVRAHIARYLHRFYDQYGNSVEVEAERIVPGEPYWQEHLMVNPVGEDYGFGDTPDDLPDFVGEPGWIIDLYGCRTGELALVNDLIRLSRDASIGVLKTGPGNAYSPGDPNYVCILYSDGTYREVEASLEYYLGHIAVSWDGELIVTCTTDYDLSNTNGRIIGYDRLGNDLFSTDVGETLTSIPAISPNSEYIGITTPNSIVLLDAHTGEIIQRYYDCLSSSIVFAPTGERFVATGITSGICVSEFQEQSNSWSLQSALQPQSGSYLESSLCANQELIAVCCKETQIPGSIHGVVFYSVILNEGDEIYRNPISNVDLSPNGFFGFAFNQRTDSIDDEPSSLAILSVK